MPDKIVLGSPNRRKYFDALGRPLSVGDVIMYSTSRSSSVYNNYARIVEIKDTSKPAYLGTIDNSYVASWDRAFELKVEYMQFDRIENRFVPPTVYDRTVAGRYRPRRPDEKKKLNTIKRVDRVLRLDLDDE